jgi:hypothetical protein
MLLFLLTFTVDINCVLPCSKLLPFALLLDILEIFPVFTVGSSRTLNVVPLLDVHQPQISFTKIMIYLGNICLHVSIL